MKISNSIYGADLPQCRIADCEDTAPTSPTNSYDPATRYSFQDLNDSPKGAAKVGRSAFKAFKADDDAPKSW